MCLYAMPIKSTFIINQTERRYIYIYSGQERQKHHVITTKAIYCPAHRVKSSANKGSIPNIVLEPMFSPGISLKEISELTPSGSDLGLNLIPFTRA